MKVVINKLPDIRDYMQYSSLVSISSDITIVIVYKTLYRSDDILVDIYLNEIADDTKIISGRKLSTNSIISLPRYDLGFTYWIECIDPDNVNASINKYNANKFYLQLTSYEGDEWNI